MYLGKKEIIFDIYVQGMKIGRAVAITDKKDPALPTAIMIKYFSKIMSKRWVKFMLMGDALKDVMHYNPHMVMEEQEIKKVFMDSPGMKVEFLRPMMGGRWLVRIKSQNKSRQCILMNESETGSKVIAIRSFYRLHQHHQIKYSFKF